MAEEIQSNIRVNIDTAGALAGLKLLQKEISAFHTQMSKAGAANAAATAGMSSNLINTINQTGKFSASMTTVRSSTESFTRALEANKFSMGQYFRYAGGASRSFGKMFATEFNTINTVARERVKDLQTQYIKMGTSASGAIQAIKVRPLTLDMQNLGTQTMIAAQRQQLLNQMLDLGTTKLLNFGKNMQWAGRQLMVGFTVPLTIFAGAAISAYKQIEAERVQITRVYGTFDTTRAQSDAAAKSVENLARQYTQYGIAVKDTMALGSTVATTGAMGKDLTQQVAAASQLSVLGRMSQQEAFKSIMVLKNAFHLSGQGLTDTIGLMNATQNQTVNSIQDITEATIKAGPVVQALGGNMSDLLFFTTAMREGGVSASQGANALKSALGSLINPSTKASTLLASLGINLKGIVQANKGNLRATVTDFADALDKLDPLKRAQALETLFGKFQFARVSALFSNINRAGSQAQAVAGLGNASSAQLTGLMKREMAQVSESPLYKFQKQLADFQAAIAPIGESFMKFLTPILKFFSDLFKGFSSLPDGMKTAIVGIATILGGVAPLVLMLVGLIANAAANMGKFLVGIKKFFNGLTSHSKVLGEEVQYLNQEEIDAAAQAASLDQVHQKLVQTFTAETESVNLLTAAYERAVAAQRAFSMPMGMPGMPGGVPKRYANGVVMVPGPKGAGDVVPAMLSPGEAVIPAAHVQKYGGLINGMVAGNIPGYETGLGVPPGLMGKAFGNATLYMPESWNTRMNSQGAGVPMGEVTQYFKQAGAAAMTPLMAVMAKEMGMKVSDPRFIEEWTLVGDKLSMSVITALEKSGEMIASDKTFEKFVVPALLKDSEELSVAGKSIAMAMNNAVNDIRTVAPIGVASGANAAKSRQSGLPQGRTKFAGSYASTAVSKDAAAAATLMNPAMYQNQTRFSESRGKTISEFKTLNTSTGQWEIATKAHIMESLNLAYQDILAKMTPILGNVGQRLLKAIGGNVVKGTEEALGIASPSKEGQYIGEMFAEGLIQGTKSGSRRVSSGVATNSVGTIASPITKAIVVQEQQYLKNLESQNTVMMESLQIKLQNAQMIGAETAFIEREIAERQAELDAIAANIVAVEEETVVTQQVVQSQSRRVQRAETEWREDLGMRVVKGSVSNVPYGPQQKGPGFRERYNEAKSGNANGGKMASVGMAAMMAASALSMIPGPVGQTVQVMMPFIMIITSLQMVMAMFGIEMTAIATAIGIPMWALVAGLAALVGAVALIIWMFGKAAEEAKKQREATNKTTQSILALGNAAVIGKSQIENINSVLGTNATGSAISRSQLTNTGNYGTTTSQQEKNIEQFTSDKKGFMTINSNLINSLKTGTKAQIDLLLQDVGRTLSSQNVADEAIQTYVMALERAAGKQGISLNFKSIHLDTASGRAAMQEQFNSLISKAQNIIPTAMAGTQVNQKFANAQELQQKYLALDAAQKHIESLQKHKDKGENGVTQEKIDAYKNSTRKRLGLSATQDIETARNARQADFNATDATTLNKLKEFDLYATSAADSISALGTAFANGQINLSAFNSQWDAMEKSINAMSKTKRPIFINDLIEKSGLSAPLKTFIKGITDSSVQMLALRAASAGINIDKAMLQAIINGKAAKKVLDNLGKSTNYVADGWERTALAQAAAAGDKALKDLEDAYKSIFATQAASVSAIDKINNKYQDQSKIISDAESLIGKLADGVNKEYQKRLDALDKVKQINDQITKQQQDQLGLSQALSKGDIAAAAQAAITFKNNQQQAALDQQKQMIQEQQANAVAALSVTVGGKSYTKDQLDAIQNSLDIKNLTANLAGKKIPTASNGGLMGSYFDNGGSTSIAMVPKGTDVVPAMLTPGEFVVSAPAVQNFGVDNLRSINNGSSAGDSVYNYSINVSVSSNSSANDIANTVMNQIRQIDAQRIRGVRS